MISRIQITGIHGDQDIDQELFPGLNILHAKNGAGKTTFLHVIANLFERDIERFCYLRFSHITVHLQDGGVVTLRQRIDGQHPIVSVDIDGTEYAQLTKSGEVDPTLDQLLYDKLGGRPVYLPAFRSILEASQDSGYAASTYRVASRDNEELQAILNRERQRRRTQKADYPGDRTSESVAIKTVMCRGWFGDFVPVVRYPSLSDVDRALSREIRQAYFAVSRTDQRILSNIFLKVFDAIVRREASPLVIDTSALLDKLVTKLGALNQASVSGSEIYAQLEQRLRQQSGESLPLPDEARIKVILSIYDEALAERSTAEHDAFKNIQRFLESVNTFLSGKSIAFHSDFTERIQSSDTYLHVKLQPEKIVPLRVLSSGERHVLTLLFSTTHMSSEDGLVLIDEPELSLHVDWQRIILGELMKQVGTRQVIACTHSPEIAADHISKMKELSFIPRIRSGDDSEIPQDDDLVSNEA